MTELTTEYLTEIITAMVDGKSLKDVCVEQGQSYRAVWRSIHAFEDLTTLYLRAREDYAHARVASMDIIVNTEKDVQRAKLKCDNIKWESARVLPKQYGDRVLHADADGGKDGLTVVLTNYSGVEGK